MPRLILSLALSLVPLGMNALSAQTCDADGTVKFVCGTTNAEDLYQVPSTPWVIASGRYSASEGPLYAVAARAVGAAYVDKNIRTWEAMQKVLDSGEHRPTHLRGWKPGEIG